MLAFDIAIAQYKLTAVPSKLVDAIQFLELAREFEILFCCEESETQKESGRLLLQLTQGCIPE